MIQCTVYAVAKIKVANFDRSGAVNHVAVVILYRKTQILMKVIRLLCSRVDFIETNLQEDIKYCARISNVCLAFWEPVKFPNF